MSTTKERLHELIDALPEEELRAAERYLQYLHELGSDPVWRAFAEAPYDDEPLTSEEEEAIRRADEEIERGETVPWEQAKRELPGDAR